MDRQTLTQYHDLCKQIRALPTELATLLADSPPIGLHLFVWREFGESRDPRPDQMGWAKFMAANNGIAGKVVGGWEKWERFPDPTGCYRFFGQGGEDALTRIRDVLTKADQILGQYEELDIAEQLEWKLPNPVRFFYGWKLPDFQCMVELVCRQVGYDKDGTQILVKEAGLELRPVNEVDRAITFDFLGLESIPDAELAGIAVYRIKDFAAAFGEAVAAWLPEDLEYQPVDIEEPKPPVAVSSPVPVVKSVTIKAGLEKFESYQLRADSGNRVFIGGKDSVEGRVFLNSLCGRSMMLLVNRPPGKSSTNRQVPKHRSLPPYRQTSCGGFSPNSTSNCLINLANPLTATPG